MKQVVGVVLYARPSWRADAQPVKPQRIAAGDPVLRVEWQEILQGFLLAAIEHVALKLRDDEREARHLCGEVPQLDTPKIGQRNFRAPIDLGAPPVDLGLDGASL
jgi:hypothetical protein